MLENLGQAETCLPKNRNTNSADSKQQVLNQLCRLEEAEFGLLYLWNERHQFGGLFTEASEKPKVIVIGLLYTDTYGFWKVHFVEKRHDLLSKPMKSISLSSIWMIRQPVF